MKDKIKKRYSSLNLKEFVNNDVNYLFDKLKITPEGLDKKTIELNQNLYGENKITNQRKDSIIFRLKRAFINPYSVVLFILAIISLFTDIIFAKAKNYTTFLVIITMLLISGIIRFSQELRSKNVSDKLVKIVNQEICVKRENKKENISFQDLVVGDHVFLKAGSKIPADIRIISAKDLFISESSLTGESKIKEKTDAKIDGSINKIDNYNNILFQGSSIISGECEGIVLAVGNNCYYGGLGLENLMNKQSFDKGSKSILMVLIKFMIILLPIVFIVSGISQGDWLDALIFALSVAVGLTPELLPMVINSCLAKGSYSMGKKKTIVKNINAMKELGGMDVLCLDKTGTLTQDKLILEYYTDILGKESNLTLDYTYLNSYFSSGVDNHLDHAILAISNNEKLAHYYDNLINEYQKLDELPFDYERKIASVLLKGNKNNILISKGPVNEIINKCNFIYYKDEVIKMSGDKTSSVNAIVDEMSQDGMKVLAIAYKPSKNNSLTIDDENDLILLGYVAFFDAPKQDAFSTINKLNNLKIKVKVLTGDDKKVTASICKRLGMDIENIMTGQEFEKLNDNEAQIEVEKTNIFVELSPKQKAQIIQLLKSNGHCVGFMGDGMNDLGAMNNANVSICVNNAASSLKESADVVLLESDLDVLENGVIEGRKSFINMAKYTKITASSNFGNILAIVIASLFLPFFPMTSIQILLLNLLYDTLCLVIPFDKVDNNMLTKPSEWNGNNLARFMLAFGPASTVFDVITFCFLYFYLCPSVCGGDFQSLSLANQNLFISIFQTGWFLESMWTQILILHLLRTNNIPFIKDKPSLSVTLITLLGIILFTIFAITPIGGVIQLTNLPPLYFLFLIGVVICYLLLITLFKHIYIKRHGSLI